jgi:bacillithiol system protein YtxJ
MQNLESPQELDAALQAPLAVLLKYSTTCPISANARREIASFESGHPDQPVYGIDVHRARELSSALADRLGVEHESPQLFILRDGAPVYTVTHWDISAPEVERELAGAR